MLNSIRTLRGRANGAQSDSNQESDVAKIVANTRKEDFFRIRADVPKHRAVLTNKYTSGDGLANVAALDCGNREALVLVAESAVGKAPHVHLRQQLAHDGYRIVADHCASHALIMELNEATSADKGDVAAAHVQPIIDEIISECIRRKGTDIHICRREVSAMVMFRIHGRITKVRQFEVDPADQIAGYLFTELGDAKTRSVGTFSLDAKSLSCMVPFTKDGVRYKLRYKFVRADGGWDVILRVLKVETPEDVTPSFEELGYALSQVRQLQLATSRSVGLIALTGPTGSGKSTTTKVMMEFDPRRLLRKRYSVEDPVEYKLFAVTQINFQRDDHASDEAASDALVGVLRDIMRADPDDVFVGETRDKGTLNVVADFVLTGHKIYTTTHTHSAIGTVPRFVRLGLDRGTLADEQFISALIFQRLLPVLCTSCRVPANSVMNESEQRLLKIRFELDTEKMFCASEEGCPHCDHLGVVGQTVVAEVVVPDTEMRRLFAEGRDEAAKTYWRKSRKTPFDDPDMTGKTAFEHALYKASCGEIDPFDIQREFEPFETYAVVECSS